MRFTQGNLLDADVDALVNTVNTMGIMGKGIALMFKERFPDNFQAYEAACKRKELSLGHMFVTESLELNGPRWIINFPTKAHWRYPSKLEWIRAGLKDLRRVILEKEIKSIAVPPLGSGNGGLDWEDVRPIIKDELSELPEVEVIVYEPTAAYQNVSKTTGVEKLTPARALIAEIVRRYEVLGFGCSMLEVQKLAWVLTRVIHRLGLVDPLKLTFEAGRYGPYADDLRHLLDNLDGSYLHSEKRLADAGPADVLHFAPDHHEKLAAYLRKSEVAAFVEAIEKTDALIDGFQSPLGMEAFATVGWLLEHENPDRTVDGVRNALNQWPTPGAAERKRRLFNDKLIQAALDRISTSNI
jgi:O-acetyl-ADP-ribose deacetylase (regulator of RNase III)